MKKLNLFVLAFSALALVSCSNEEGNPEPELKNQAEYKGAKILFSEAVTPPFPVEYDPQVDYIFLATGNLVKTEVDKLIFDGSEGILIYLVNKSEGSVEEGNYSVTNKLATTDRYANIQFYNDTNSDEKIGINQDDFINGSGGEVNLSFPEEGIYELTFDVTLENGEKLTGYYKGQVFSSSQLPSNN